MRVVCYYGDGNVYTSNVYLVLGTWNALVDVNTLVDVGRDPGILKKLENASTGVGKKRVEQVILTHCHYDHVELLPAICAEYHPKVYALSPFWAHDEAWNRTLGGNGTFQTVKDGDRLNLGDKTFEVVHTPGHSSDSLCLYCEEDGLLFAGDTPLIIRSPATYEDDYVDALARLSRKNIRTIYFGHGAPLVEGCNEALQESLRRVRRRSKAPRRTKAGA